MFPIQCVELVNVDVDTNIATGLMELLLRALLLRLPFRGWRSFKVLGISLTQNPVFSVVLHFTITHLAPAAGKFTISPVSHRCKPIDLSFVSTERAVIPFSLGESCCCCQGRCGFVFGFGFGEQLLLSFSGCFDLASLLLDDRLKSVYLCL